MRELAKRHRHVPRVRPGRVRLDKPHKYERRVARVEAAQTVAFQRKPDPQTHR